MTMFTMGDYNDAFENDESAAIEMAADPQMEGFASSNLYSYPYSSALQSYDGDPPTYESICTEVLPKMNVSDDSTQSETKRISICYLESADELKEQCQNSRLAVEKASLCSPLRMIENDRDNTRIFYNYGSNMQTLTPIESNQGSSSFEVRRNSFTNDFKIIFGDAINTSFMDIDINDNNLTDHNFSSRNRSCVINIEQAELSAIPKLTMTDLISPCEDEELPSYRSIIVQRLKDCPPTYENVTGIRVNIDEIFKDPTPSARDRFNREIRSCSDLNTSAKRLLALMATIIIAVCVVMIILTI